MIDKKLYQDAIFSQSACNLSGLSHSLSAITTEVWKEANELGKGTAYVNAHPVIQLFVYQMFCLAFGSSPNTDGQWEKANDACQEKAKE